MNEPEGVGKPTHLSGGNSRYHNLGKRKGASAVEKSGMLHYDASGTPMHSRFVDD